MSGSLLQKILYVSHLLEEDNSALKQAINIASRQKSSLTAMIICPIFPDSLSKYEEQYIETVEKAFHERLNSIVTELGLEKSDFKISLVFEPSAKPAQAILNKVTKEPFDLVIKKVEGEDAEPGFKALDMTLLRQCPCPLWLARNTDTPWAKMQVAVAIDPLQVNEGKALSLDLLHNAQAVAKLCSGQLTVISCWDYEFEDYLRSNPWVQIEKQKLTELLLKVEKEHQQSFGQLLNNADLEITYTAHTMKGAPEDAIPDFVQNKGIDVLVMGSLGRTGIPGFLIGNTAENTFQKLSSSLLAMRPKETI